MGLYETPISQNRSKTTAFLSRYETLCRAVAAVQKWSDGRSRRVPKAREGGEHERRYYSPLVSGVWGVSPRKYLNFGCFYVRFKWDFYAFGTRLQPYWSRSFASKDISCHMRNRMLDKIVFELHDFFSTARFFDIIPSMFLQVLAKYF